MTAEPEESARRRRALRAAEELFKRVGFRGVTMEAVAREAAISKVTLYSYFKNKDELFVAVCERMVGLLERGLRDALHGEGTLDARVTAAVLAKLKTNYVLILTSPHAADLYAQRDQLSRDLFTSADRRMLADLAGTLREDPKLAPRAEALARALFYGGSGLAAAAANAEALDVEVSAFVATVLAGARTQG
jgi:AcrR family transcriptional regulator